jgi:hypothetical protein
VDARRSKTIDDHRLGRIVETKATAPQEQRESQQQKIKQLKKIDE